MSVEERLVIPFCIIASFSSLVFHRLSLLCLSPFIYFCFSFSIFIVNSLLIFIPIPVFSPFLFSVLSLASFFLFFFVLILHLLTFYTATLFYICLHTLTFSSISLHILAFSCVFLYFFNTSISPTPLLLAAILVSNVALPLWLLGITNTNTLFEKLDGNDNDFDGE